MKTYGGVEVYHRYSWPREWSTSRPGRFATGERAPGMHSIAGWVNPVEEKKFLAPVGNRISAAHSVARRYTGWGTSALRRKRIVLLGALLGGGPFGRVLAHAPRNSTVEVFPSCPHMDCCYTTYGRWRYTTVCRDHVTCAFCDSRWHNTTVAVTWRVSCDACLYHVYITRFPA
jgi:hypothetical protein